jgi:ADP-ribosyl-[dinitrogen reductase] hydrolase
MTIKLCDDADATEAVHGQIAGAYYSKEGIPCKWLSALAVWNLIASLADQLYQITT